MLKWNNCISSIHICQILLHQKQIFVSLVIVLITQPVITVKIRPFYKCMICGLFLFLLMISPANGFSILAHEAIIDAEWESQIKPMLLKRYPDTKPEDLKAAHGYAYGGALVADMGYMPFGEPYFTDLLHYVRSGDMVKAL